VKVDRRSSQAARRIGPSPPNVKITRPVAGTTYPRRRLFRRIDRLRKHPILWISGPPGCGKTTLVSSYLSCRGDPYLWYRVDESDQDIASFFYAIGLAARRAAPGKRRPLPVLTREYLPGLSMFAAGFFEGLFGRLGSGSVVVFDDYQKVPAKSQFHEVVRDGLACMPDGISAVIISRGDPHRLFARGRVHREMEVIGWKDLRLTAEETRGIARLRGGRKRNAEQIRSLHSRSDGWAAGLVLLLEKSSEDGGKPQRLADHTPNEVFEYFAGEVFDGLGEEAKRFLLISAFLPRMTARMAEHITGHRRAGTILSYLNRNSHFTEMRESDKPEYEYHPLFREFLLSRARELLPENEIRRIRNRAGKILEESGHDDEALSLFRESGDWRRMVRIILRGAASHVRQGRSGILAEWIFSLPEPLRREDPWILYWTGVCLLPDRPDESRRDFEESFRRFRLRKEPEGAFLAWSGIVDSIVYGSGSLKSIDGWFSTLSDLMGTEGTFPSSGIEESVTCSAIRALALRRPSNVDMHAWAERAAVLAGATRDLLPKFSLLLHVAYFRFHGGEFPEVKLLLESLRRLARKPQIPPVLRLSLCWIEAAFANMNGLHDRCRTVVAEGIGIADASGVHLMDFLLMGHGALSALHRGDLPDAEKTLRAMASMLPMVKPWEASFYHQLAAWESLHREDRANAAFHSDRCLEICEAVGNRWTEALARVQKAFVHQEAGEEQEASRNLGAALRIGEECGMKFVRFACLLAGGIFFLERGEMSSGIDSLREGLRVGRENGFTDIYLWRPGLLEAVAAAALEHRIETEYVRDLVRRNGLVPGDGTEEIEQWPRPLKICTLGGFDLRREDRSFPVSRKAQHKPFLLLKALISLGGKRVPEARLSDLLWPDADGDLAHQSFATTLSRLRRLLGIDQALLLREGRLSLDTRICWVDALAFESLLEKFDAACRDDDPCAEGGRARILAGSAVSLYRGPFLPGEGSDTRFLPTRERLRSKFHRAVGFLGNCLENESKWEEAVVCYRKGLEVDELGEEVYRRLMICHRRMGQVPEALGVYRRCRETLAATLGIPPSAETEALAKSLR